MTKEAKESEVLEASGCQNRTAPRSGITAVQITKVAMEKTKNS